MTIDETITAGRWGLVAETLIRHRDALRWLALPAEDCGRRDAPEQKDCFRRAANALGPTIAEAVKHRQEYRDQQEAARPKMPAIERITDEQLQRLGAEVAADPTCHELERQGRPMTNVEMLAWREHDDNEKRQRIDRDGCCGDGPMSDGYCFGIGKCPRHQEAERCTAFVQKWLAWLDQINDESALAAVAARLSVPPCLEMGVENV